MSVDMRNRSKKDDKIVFLNKSVLGYRKYITVPYSKNTNYYELKTVSFEIADRRITITPIMMMIDSGTTFSHFPTEHSDSIFDALNAYCRKNRDECGRLPRPNFNSDTCLELRMPDSTYSTLEKLYESFPPIKIYFQGVKEPYVLRPKNYFYQEYNQNAPADVYKICMAIKGEEHGKIILGAFSMIDYYFYFDRKEGNIMMFEENCYLRTSELLMKRRERVLEDYLAYASYNESNIKMIGAGFGLAVLVILMYVIWRKRSKNENSVPENLSVFMKSYSSESGM